MQSHGPKRVYTPHSLEFWFGKLEKEWSQAFSTTQLEQGRKIYVDGEVRESKTVSQNAVHVRVDLAKAKRLTLEVDFGPGGDVYADVNWANPRLVE